MKKYLFFIVVAAVLCTLPATSLADSIKGRLGVTGRLGLMVPADYNFTIINPTSSPSAPVDVLASGKAKADTSFAGGGGFICGVSDHIAVEVDVLHTPEIDYEISGQKRFEITTTNVSLGLQYRFIPENMLVPYLGGGVDFIISDGTYVRGDKLDVETVMGGHLNAGADLFVTRRIALNVDVRGVLAPEANVAGQLPSISGALRAKYDPISFIALFGVRFFLN